MIHALPSNEAIGAASCVVKIAGGLGNQMLQYAAGRAVALRCSCPLELDLSFYARKRHRKFELGAFPIDAHLRPSPRGWQRIIRGPFGRTRTPGNIYQETSKTFDPRFRSLRAPVRLEGYFFSEKYFADHAETIRQELAPPRFSDAASLELQRRIASSESTALHVRRGDYVTNKNASQLFWSCSLEYYERAIERIPNNGEVFVFSDDVPWARANLRSSKRLVFVGDDSSDEPLENAGLRDLWLMTHAHHHIIANSSFSWWGAWLADPDKGLKIAPQKWFNDPTIDDSDIIPERWLRI